MLHQKTSKGNLCELSKTLVKSFKHDQSFGPLFKFYYALLLSKTGDK